MLQKSYFQKVFVLTIFVSMAISPALTASDWNISVAGTPDNTFEVSNDSRAVMLVELETDGGKAINESMLTDSSKFEYLYNKTQGTPKGMVHYHDEYWFSTFRTDLVKHSQSSKKASILYNATGVTEDDSIVDSNGEANDTADITIGNFTVNPLTDLTQEFLPGHEARFEVNVTNLTSGNHIPDSNVRMYFTNGSWTSEGYTLSHTDGADNLYYNSSVNIPQGENSSYVVRFLAYNRSSSTGNPFGSHSAFIDTAPELKGEVVNFSAREGCSTEEMVTKCEPDSIISTTFNVTSSTANEVVLRAFKVNRSNGALVEYYNNTLLSDDSLYSTEFGIPEINTSKFKREVLVRFNATTTERHYVTERTVNYDSLKLKDRGPYSTQQGQSYTVKFFASKPYTLTRYDKSRFSNMTVNISDSNGDQFTSINKSELDYDSSEDIFREDIIIPSNAPTGSWSVDLRAEDIYSHAESLSWAFSVDQSDVTFNVNDTTLNIDELGNQSFNISVENMASTKLQAKTNISSNLEGLMNISEDGEFNVSAGATENVSVDVELNEVQDIGGSVNFTDKSTGYSQVIDMTIDMPDCKFKSGHLCSLSDKWINVTSDSKQEINRSVEINYLAGEGNSTNVSVSTTGNISEYIQLPQTNYQFEDSQMVDINYTVEKDGNYTGEILINPENGTNLTFSTSLNANITDDNNTDSNATENDTSLRASKSKLDLGVFPEGVDREATFMISNNGDLPIENISAMSETFNVSINASELTLSSGNSELVKAQFLTVNSSEGNITVTGNTTEGEVSVELEVNGTIVPNYKNKIQDLRSRIEQVRPIYQSNLTQTVTTVSGLYPKIRTDWDSGNYLQARAHYNRADSLVTYIENNAQDSGDTGTGGDSGDDGQTGGDTGGSDDGDTGSTGGTGGGDTGGTGGGDTGGTTGQQQQEDSGLPIIPIVAVLAILLIGGFVFYESYIPEEGDPLYGVLGEE